MVTASLVALGALGTVGMNWYLLRQLRTYDPVTMEMPYTSAPLIPEFALDGRRTPSDFGVETWREVSTPSFIDRSLQLRGWLLPATGGPSSEAIVFVHGRWSNRLKPMGYLELMQTLGLDETHHLLFPDLRNSGASDEAETGMGYHFAEDLTAWLLHLHETVGVERVTIYAFSMGAMATAVMGARPELKAALDEQGLQVERVVMDSPLSNVQGNVEMNAARQGFPTWLVAMGLHSFSRTVDSALPSLRLSQLRPATTWPWLILQGTADVTTPHVLLQREVAAMDPAHVRLRTFPDGQHVKMYRASAHRAAYTAEVAAFLGSPKLITAPDSLTVP